MAYIFYDTETTGTRPGYDQVMQFAAVLTDDDFNVIDSFEIRSRLMPHVVPSPAALVVTKVWPDQLTDKSLPSQPAMMRAIQRKLAEWGPATIVGYNSFKFDEEMLRQGFYQSLLPIYQTQIDGKDRADVLRLMHAFQAHAPGAIRFPINEKGKPSFKLDRIAPANGFSHDNAHDALADVMATIHMARIARERNPALYDGVMGLRAKQAVEQFVADHGRFVLTEPTWGNLQSGLYAACGRNPKNPTEIALFDLTQNPDEFINMSESDLVRELNRFPVQFIKPIRTNGQPILRPESELPGESPAALIPKAELDRRCAVLAANPDFIKRVGVAMSQRFRGFQGKPYVEAQIYSGGFITNADQYHLDEFHALPLHEKRKVLPKLADKRLKELGQRMLYVEDPSSLTKRDQQAMARWTRKRLGTTQPDAPWTSLPKAYEELAELEKTAAAEQKPHLKAIRRFYDKLAKANGIATPRPVKAPAVKKAPPARKRAR